MDATARLSEQTEDDAIADIRTLREDIRAESQRYAEQRYGFVEEHFARLLDWRIRLDVALSMLSPLRVRQETTTYEPPRCTQCDQPVLDNSDCVCVDCWNDTRQRTPEKATATGSPRSPQSKGPEPIKPLCMNYCPSTWTGHWREWHRGHGCHLDPSTPSPPQADEKGEP